MTLSNKSKGFSLVEVLIALVILSVSLLALAGLMVQTTHNNSFGNHMTEASTVAQDIFERLRARPYNSMTCGPPDNVYGSSGQKYTRDCTVVHDTGGTEANAVIRVRWDDSTKHEISFDYKIYNFDK